MFLARVWSSPSRIVSDDRRVSHADSDADFEWAPVARSLRLRGVRDYSEALCLVTSVSATFVDMLQWRAFDGKTEEDDLSKHEQMVSKILVGLTSSNRRV